MSMIEDEALAIYSAAKEQQAAIAKAIETMNKASADISSRYTDFHAVLGRVEKVPQSALEPIKATVEASIGTGLEKHLTAQTKALSGSVTRAEGRIDAIKDRGLFALAGVAFATGLMGVIVGLLAGWYAVSSGMIHAPVREVAASPPALEMTAEAPAKKKKQP